MRFGIYTAAVAEMVVLLGEAKEQTSIYMGDRSPKSVQKQAKQKQDKSNAANQKKQAATAAKKNPKK